MRYNKEDANELISSDDSSPIEFYAVIAVLTNNINILDATFPTEEQAIKYKSEEQTKWENCRRIYSINNKKSKNRISIDN